MRFAINTKACDQTDTQTQHRDLRLCSYVWTGGGRGGGMCWRERERGKGGQELKLVTIKPITEQPRFNSRVAQINNVQWLLGGWTIDCLRGREFGVGGWGWGVDRAPSFAGMTGGSVGQARPQRAPQRSTSRHIVSSLPSSSAASPDAVSHGRLCAIHHHPRTRSCMETS